MSSGVILALESAWRAVQKAHPDLPDVVIVTGRRRHKSELATHCHHAWLQVAHGPARVADTRLSEVWVSGERLADGGELVIGSLLHEAAHALAKARDIADTSNRNRYHNKEFVKLAEELSLRGPDSSAGPSLGYSNCTPTAQTRERYAAEIEAVSEACVIWAKQEPDEAPKPRKPSRKAHCACDEDSEISWPKAYQKRFDAGRFILCGVCRSAFEPEDEEE